MVRDMGNFVGRYFQTLAFVSVAGMIVDLLDGGGFRVDCTFILMAWIGIELRRHSPLARKVTLAMCALFLLLVAASFTYAAIAGTQGMNITIGKPIETPSLAHVGLVAIVLGAIFGVPFALLLTRRARAEFTPGT